MVAPAIPRYGAAAVRKAKEPLYCSPTARVTAAAAKARGVKLGGPVRANEKASCGTGISDASFAWRADINFLARIIKRRCPTAPQLPGMKRKTQISISGSSLS